MTTPRRVSDRMIIYLYVYISCIGCLQSGVSIGQQANKDGGSPDWKDSSPPPPTSDVPQTARWESWSNINQLWWKLNPGGAKIDAHTCMDTWEASAQRCKRKREPPPTETFNRLPHLVRRVWTEKKGKKKEENKGLTLLVTFVVLTERRVSARDIFPIFICQLSFVFKLKSLFYILSFRTVASLHRFILSFLSILSSVFGLCLLPSPPFPAWTTTGQHTPPGLGTLSILCLRPSTGPLTFPSLFRSVTVFATLVKGC